MSQLFHPSILREYDIRGIVGETLGEADAYAVGRSFATMLLRSGGAKVAVGYDGRLTSPMLEAALVRGLTESGCDVMRIGVCPTPMLYYAEASAEELEGGIQVTGSHNPPDHNGFKMVLRGGAFFGPDILELGRIAAVGSWIEGAGTVETREILDKYVESLVTGLDGVDIEGLRSLRIGWDAGNGAAGPSLEALIRRLPGEHHWIFTEIDGHFPNHHPDPTIEANLVQLRQLVEAKKLDFGVAFDGDGDRLGLIDSEGRIIWGDQLLAIFAEDVLETSPKARIIADVKASQSLFDRIAELGGAPEMWKSGHSLIKSRMKQTGALLGGEMSGHVFFADRYYGFDDALYAAVRLMAATIRLGRSVTELRSAMPEMINTPELRFPVDEARKFAIVEDVRDRLERAGATFCALDGVRVTSQDGWWLLRASNTQAVLVARAESETRAGLDRLIGEVDAQLALSGVARHDT